tara:strand:- start:6 stop:1583 length:1578 start_codon:yes stop_codon:yes gene_type:complete
MLIKNQNLKLSLLLICFCYISVNSQNTIIPDDNFEQALIDLGYDSGPLNNLVPTANIENIDILGVGNKGITDLTGIEDFVGLISLNADDNNLTSVDLSGNINLKIVAINRNELTSINVSNNLQLEVLNLDQNQLTQIDVSNNTDLTLLLLNFNQLNSLSIENNLNILSLSCFINNISSFTLPENSSMEFLNVSSNPLDVLNVTNGEFLFSLSAAEAELSEIDLSQNILLETLLLSDNNFESIDLSNNELLYILFMDSNPVSELDLSQNPKLWEIRFGNTQLENIDLSFNLDLERVVGNDNAKLCSLDIRNENNTLISDAFNLANCPLVECVFVDDVTYSETNWTNIGANVNFITSEEDCVPSCCPVDFDYSLTLNNIVMVNNQIQVNLNQPENFLYSIDTNDNYQEEPFFFNVSQGSHTIYVIDVNGCLEKSIDVTVLEINKLYIPKFFTPNGDNNNDLWKVIDPNSVIEVIYIFNRYGKLLKTLSPTSNGWNGMYNGSLPNSDYWYKINLKTGESLNGHFSLRL